MFFREGLHMLRTPAEGEDIVADYASTGLSLRRHPLACIRDNLNRMGIVKAIDLQSCRDSEQVDVAGIVITRQRPGSAAGVTFVTLEDETGYINLIIWESVAEKQRKVLLESRLLGVRGRVQRDSDVLHVVAECIENHSALLGKLVAPSRDFH